MLFIFTAAGTGRKSFSAGDSENQRQCTEQKKSILKHRDPESEQLLSGLGEERARKPRALPVKFVGVDDKEGDSSRPRRVLPRSPMPLEGRDRAPLADLLADFGGQEKAARDELTPENLLKDALEPLSSDNRSANILRCSRSNCTSNKPITPDTAAHLPSAMCVCGAIMTNINSPPMGDHVSSSVHYENRLPTEDLNNGPTPAREVEDFLYADQNSPSEETQLLGGSPAIHKGSKINS